MITTTTAATPATMATTFTHFFFVRALVPCCTSLSDETMICMVWPEEPPPALARSSANFFAASSARFAVWVSALTRSSLAMAFISPVVARFGVETCFFFFGAYRSRSASETASVFIAPPSPSAASNSTFTSGPPAPIWISSPWRSRCLVTRWPSTSVPLVEPVSTTNHCPSS